MKSFPFILRFLFNLTLLVILSFVTFKFFQIKDIKCIDQVDNTLSNCNVYADLYNRSLFFVTKKNQVLNKSYLDEKKAQIYQADKLKKIFPHQLIIYVRKLEIVYKIKNQDQVFLVNQEGLILEDKPTVFAPIINYDNGNQLFEIGKQMDVKLHEYIIELLDLFNNNQIKFQDIRFKSAQIIEVTLENEYEVIFLKSQNPELIIKKLQLILNNISTFPIDKQITEIDLRFNLPILR